MKGEGVDRRGESEGTSQWAGSKNPPLPLTAHAKLPGMATESIATTIDRHREAPFAKYGHTGKQFPRKQ